MGEAIRPVSATSNPYQKPERNCSGSNEHAGGWHSFRGPGHPGTGMHLAAVDLGQRQILGWICIWRASGIRCLLFVCLSNGPCIPIVKSWASLRDPIDILVAFS